MKKKIFLILSIILLTGCQIKYQLNFEDEKLIENISIQLPNSEEKKINDIKKYEAYSTFDNSFQTLYEVKYSDDKNKFIANYQYIYNFEEFRHALYIKSCFDAFSFVTNNDNYILSTTEGFNCMFVDYNKVDEVEVIITTNHEIIESNADQVENNKLIWEINDENSEEKSIYVKFGKVEELNIFEKIINFIKENLLVFIIFGGLLSIIGIGILIIVIIGKKNNEI